MRTHFLSGRPRFGRWIFTTVTVLLFISSRLLQAQEVPARSVAFTIDDLPTVRGLDLVSTEGVTLQILEALQVNDIPAIGFVNESKLNVPGERAIRAGLLAAWLEAGYELGNHSYSHKWFYETPTALFLEDVIKGEKVTTKLLEDRGLRLRYFRHPRLNTGPNAAARAQFEAFLEGRGYDIAPVTIDNDEFIYALAYHKAHLADDKELMGRIGRDYIRYMAEVFHFYEQYSIRIIGREPSQILLIHANRLNADYIGQLAGMLRIRGYAFVSLGEALNDPAYELADTYIGRKGLSWIQRWAHTLGKEVETQPGLPSWVNEVAWQED